MVALAEGHSKLFSSSLAVERSSIYRVGGGGDNKRQGEKRGWHVHGTPLCEMDDRERSGLGYCNLRRGALWRSCEENFLGWAVWD